MEYKNPFKGMAYVTEKGVRPEKVLERYSLLPFKHLITYLTEPINSFFVGRTGVGKTMVLTLFDPTYQRALYLSTEDKKSNVNRNDILNVLPKEVIGIYSNIDSPYIRHTQFQGRIQSDDEWIRTFGDYYGHILARNFITTFEKLSEIDKWREHNKINEIDINKLDKISQWYSKKIKDEIPDAKDISNWKELKLFIDRRISSYIKAVSKLGNRSFSGPSETVQLITPSLYLMKYFKKYGLISRDCRLFIIIDQYETLYEHRKNIDFRPIFNLAMRQAARGNTRIEFKIGVRPYGYRDNLNIHGSGSKLDLEKECNEIIIDEHTDKYYRSFISDLTRKCLNLYPEYQQYSRRVGSFFTKLKPVEEVKTYLGKSILSEKHFSLFFNITKSKKIISMDKKSPIGQINGS